MQVGTIQFGLVSLSRPTRWRHPVHMVPAATASQLSKGRFNHPFFVSGLEAMPHVMKEKGKIAPDSKDFETFLRWQVRRAYRQSKLGLYIDHAPMWHRVLSRLKNGESLAVEIEETEGMPLVKAHFLGKSAYRFHSKKRAFDQAQALLQDLRRQGITDYQQSASVGWLKKQWERYQQYLGFCLGREASVSIPTRFMQAFNL